MIFGDSSHASSDASKEEVEEIQREAPDIYGPTSDEGVTSGIGDYAVLLALVASAAVVVAVILILRRRGQRGTT